MDEYMDVYMDGWMDGWMDVYMDGKGIDRRMFVCMYIY